jgi:hypothetical protein
MKANETSTSDEIAALLADFAEKNDISVSLVKTIGGTDEYVESQKKHSTVAEWRIDLDRGFSLIVASDEFPDHLVGELIALADGLRNRLHEMGS